MKRILATILAMVMLCTIMGVTVFADTVYPVNIIKEDFDDSAIDKNLFRIGNTSSSSVVYITDPETGNVYVQGPGTGAFYVGGNNSGYFEAAGNFIADFEMNFDNCTEDENFFSYNFTCEDNTAGGLPKGLLGYRPGTGEDNGTLYVNYNQTGEPTTYPTTGVAGVKLQDGWNKIRVFLNKLNKTVRLYVNGQVAKDANGTVDFKYYTNGYNADTWPNSKIYRFALPINTSVYVDNIYVRQEYIAGGEDNDVCKVVSFSPSVDGDIPVDAESITYTFNHEINADYVAEDEITINGTNDMVKSVSVSGKNVTINFATALAGNTTYNVDFGFAEDIYSCALPAATFSTPTLKIVSASVPTVNADTSTLLTFQFNENLKDVTAADISMSNATIEWAGVKDNVLSIIVSHTAGWPNATRKEMLLYNTQYSLNLAKVESVSGLKLPAENAQYVFKTKYTKYSSRNGDTSRAGSPIIEENFDGFILANLTDKIWGDITAIKSSLVNISNHGENKYLNLSEIKRVSTESGKTFYNGGNGGRCYNVNLYGDAAIEFDMKFDGVAEDYTFLNIGAENTENRPNIKYSAPYNNLLQFNYVEDGADTVGVLLDDPESYNDSDSFYQRKKANASLPIKEGEWNNIKILFNRDNTTLRLYVNGEIAKNAEGKTDFEFCFGQTTENYKDYPIANITIGAPGTEGTNVYIDNVVYRQLYATGPDSAYCEQVTGTTFTPETKTLTYTYNHEIDASSVYGVAINGSTEYIKSASASGNTVTVELNDILPANGFYELDFGFTTDIYSCGLPKVKFNTDQYNLSFANFEGNAVDTAAWTLSGTNATMEGNALKISKADGVTGNISNSAAFSYSGDVIVKTSVKLNSEGAMTFMNVAGISDLVSVDNTGDNTVVKFGEYETETVAYGEAITVTDTDSYIDIALSIDTDKDIYYGFVNGIKYGPYSLAATGVDAVTSYSFGLNTAAESMGVLVDDIFVGTKIFADKTENYGFSGEGSLKYNATIINRAPETASFKLIVTTLSNNGQRLESVDLIDVLVPANGRVLLDKSYEIEEGEVIKAIYLENIGTMEHFGADGLFTTAQK